MTSTDSAGARPTSTMASQPQRLPASAKPLLASESLKRPVRGLRLTTANLADVVSGLPTSGLNAKIERRLGRQRIGSGAAFVQQQARAEAAAAEILPQDVVGYRHALRAAIRDVDAQVVAEVAWRRHYVRVQSSECRSCRASIDRGTAVPACLSEL